SPRFPLDALYLEEPALLGALAGRPALAVHDSEVATRAAAAGLSALELVPAGAPRIAFGDHAELERALGKGKGGAARQRTLTPLVSAVREWQDSSHDVVFTARTESQARRLAALLEARELNVHFEGADDDDRDPRALTAAFVPGSHETGIEAAESPEELYDEAEEEARVRA